MKKNIIYAFLVAAALIFTACGSDSKPDPIAPIDQAIDTEVQLYISPESFTVTSPREVKDITIVTVNAQNVGISTNIQLEQPFIDNIDYGQFDTTNVTTNTSGYAVVKYTAPADMTGLAERNITVTELNQSVSKELNIKFHTVSQSDTYEIVGIVPGSFAVDSVDNFGIKIVNIATGAIIDDANVHAVNLTSKFANMLLFANGTDATNYSDLGENNAISIESQTLSGVAIIEVSADINDGTNDVTITASIPVTIISGPVTALSIPYVGSGPCESDQTSSLQSNKHLVHAVDKYNNPAQVRITPTLINGTKLIVQNSNYGVGTGGIDNTTNFRDSVQDFSVSKIETTDRLIITPNTSHYDYSYMGNWTIDEVNNAHTLKLAEKFTAAPVVTGLSYIIGSEDRLLGGDLTVAHVVDPKGGYETDGNGTLLLEVCFDPKLAGHTFTLGAYAQDNNRTGIATIEAFRWDEFTTETVEVENDGTTQIIYLDLGIGGDISEPLVDVDISPSSILVETKPHCVVDNILSNFHTDAGGNVKIVLNTDGNTSATGGVDSCTIEWDAKGGSILYEY